MATGDAVRVLAAAVMATGEMVRVVVVAVPATGTHECNDSAMSNRAHHAPNTERSRNHR